MGRTPKKKGGSKNKGYRAPRKNNSPKDKRAEDVAIKANPFETQTNKRKHITLGRQGRQEKGHPGISRSSGINKRKRTLLKDYLGRNKSNSLVDRRIGERSNNLPEEDKIVRRSVVEKKKQYKKKSIFNLNDDEDEILTHKGKSLETVGRYEDPRESSDSEDERLNEAFVGEANFGGGFLKRKLSKDEDGEFSEEKTRAEIIADLIHASKTRKMLKSNEDAELYEKILKLDDDLKDPTTRKLLEMYKTAPPTDKSKTDTESAYDRSLKELQFDKKGAASDSLKVQEKKRNDEPSAIGNLKDLIQLNDLTVITKAIVDHPQSYAQGVMNSFQEFQESEHSYLSCNKITDVYASLLEDVLKSTPEYIENEFEILLNYCTKWNVARLSVFLLISKLYPHSHRLRRSAVVVLAKLLNEAKPESADDVDRFLPFCRIMYSYTKENKSYCPEVLKLLRNMLLSFDESQKAYLLGIGVKLKLWDLSEERKLKLIKDILPLIKKFIILFEELSAATEIFEILKGPLEVLKSTCELDYLSSLADDILAKMNDANLEKECLETKRIRPKMLRMYEPEILTDIATPAKKSKMSKEEGYLAKKVKSETKSAVRELKKDNAFLGRQQWKEELQSDAERNAKVKALMGSLANQEGDYQKLKKKK